MKNIAKYKRKSKNAHVADTKAAQARRHDIKENRQPNIEAAPLSRHCHVDTDETVGVVGMIIIKYVNLSQATVSLGTGLRYA